MKRPAKAMIRGDPTPTADELKPVPTTIQPVELKPVPTSIQPVDEFTAESICNDPKARPRDAVQIQMEPAMQH